MKEATFKRLYNVCFYLDDILEEANYSLGERTRGCPGVGVDYKGAGEGTVLGLIVVVLTQLHVFAKAHRAKIILFYVNQKISEKNFKRVGLTEGIFLCWGVTLTARNFYPG